MSINVLLPNWRLAINVVIWPLRHPVVFVIC
jgi:hypothetical protein